MILVILLSVTIILLHWDRFTVCDWCPRRIYYFSVLAHLTSGPDNSLSWNVLCQIFSRISGLHPLDASSTHTPQNCDHPKCPQTLPGVPWEGEANCPHWGITAVGFYTPGNTVIGRPKASWVWGCCWKLLVKVAGPKHLTPPGKANDSLPLWPLAYLWTPRRTAQGVPGPQTNCRCA